MDKIRIEIGKRLQVELLRRNMKAEAAALTSGIDPSIISAYLTGSRRINFLELSQLCNSLGVNPVRLAYSKKYSPAKIAFRSVGPKAQRLAAEIEDTFFLIKDFLPKITVQKLPRQETTVSRDAITEAATAANNILKETETPESFLEKHNIPVFPIRSDEKFDAFLVSNTSSAAICVNTKNPPHRIRFSLAHEISHLLFDRGVELDVDVLPSELYKTKLSKELFPEFFAYKFAEFFLIPLEEVSSLALSWPSVNAEYAQQLLDRRGTTKEVLSNAVYDALCIIGKNISYIEGEAQSDAYRSTSSDFARMDYESPGRPHQFPSRITYSTVAQKLSGLRQGRLDDCVSNFLCREKADIATILKVNRESFSESVFEHILGVLQIELR